MRDSTLELNSVPVTDRPMINDANWEPTPVNNN